MHWVSDKGSIMHEIEKLIENEDGSGVHGTSKFERIILFDGMSLVNKISQITWRHARILPMYLFKALCRNQDLFNKLTWYSIVISSLKLQRRDKRNKGGASRYKIANDTNISLKALLSHSETKRNLIAYLSEKVVIACEETQKHYIVVYENTCKTNVPIAPSLHTHEQG